MADLHGNKGLLMSILDEVSRPGEIIRDLLAGKGEGAARQLGQLGLNAVDAILPGDWLPNDVARPEDYTSGRELIGAKDDLLGKALGFGVDVLTDPLTYVPGAAVAKAGAKAGELAALGASKVVGQDALEAAGRHIRSAFGAQRISDAVRKMKDAAGGTGSIVSQAQAKAFAKAVEGLTDEERQIAFRVVNNYQRDAAGKAIPIIADDGKALATDAERSMASALNPGEAAGRQVESLKAGDALKQVKATGESRGAIGDLASGVGIEGVADPLAYDLLSDAARADIPGINVFNKHEGVQDAAARALDEAYPLQATDPLFASGIQLSNRALLNPGGGGDRIRKMLADADLGGVRLPDPERLAAKAAAKSAGKISDVADRMLTGVPEGVKPAVEEIAQKATFDTIEGHAARYANRIKQLGLPDDQAQKLIGFFDRWLPLVQEQYGEAVTRGAFSRVPGIDIAKEMPVDYVHRRFTGLTDEAGDVIGGAASSSKARTLKTGQKLIDFLNDPANAGVKLEEDIGKASIERALQQGRMAQGAELSGKLVEDAAQSARNKQQLAMKTGQAAELTGGETAALGARYKALNDPDTHAAVKAVIDDMSKAGHKEDAQVLTDAVFGMSPRGTFTSWLATANKAFKPYAVYGFGIPKFGAIVRNKVSGIWQALSNPESRGVVGGQAKRLGSDLAGAVVDSLGLNVSKDKLGSVLADWDGALSTSGGSAERAIATLAAKHPDAAAAIKAGAIDGFVRSEDLISEMTRTGWKKKFTNIAEWPARMFRGVEDRMRLGMALDLMDKMKSSFAADLLPAAVGWSGTSFERGAVDALPGASIESHAREAARIVRESLYDYSIASTHNRTARDIIPFFQFSAKAIPQQAKFLAEKPYVASALANAMASGGDAQPIYPFMENKLNIPLGGNQYVSGLGLPFEALGSIPNPSASLRDFGRQVEQNVVGSSQPLLKGTFATVAGESPYFGTEFGSYDRMPVFGSAGGLGRLYNEATEFGLPGLTPADQVARTIGKATDDRRSAGIKAIDLLTGANVVTLDRDRAMQQRLTDALASDPTVLQARTPINTSHDPETADLIRQLREIKAKQKQARMAEAAKGSVL